MELELIDKLETCFCEHVVDGSFLNYGASMSS